VAYYRFIADFSKPDSSDTHKKKIPIYIPPPEANWGPKARAKGGNRGKKDKKRKQEEQSGDAFSSSYVSEDNDVGKERVWMAEKKMKGSSSPPSSSSSSSL